MSSSGIRRRVIATLGLALFVFTTNAYAAPRRDRNDGGFFKRMVKAAQTFVNICGDTLRPPGG